MKRGESKRPTIGQAYRVTQPNEKAKPGVSKPITIGSVPNDRVMLCRGIKPGLAYVYLIAEFEGDAIDLTSLEMTKPRAERFARFIAEKFRIESEDFA